MTEAKCPQCGRVNLATDTSCRRCGATLQAQAVNGIVLEDGYVLPPPPKTELSGDGVWRDGSVLVMRKGAVLPDRCVKCNEPANPPKLKRKLTWHHPAFYLLIFVALLIYFLVAMIIRQTATIEVGLCELHRARRKENILITVTLLLVGFGSFGVAAFMNDGIYAVVGILVLLGATVYGIISLRVVAPSRIDKSFVWLQGINKDYLNLLPQWPGSYPGVR